MFDADDRQVLAQGAVVIVALVLAVVVFAAAAGLAWNVFDFMRGF